MIKKLGKIVCIVTSKNVEERFLSVVCFEDFFISVLCHGIAKKGLE